MFGDTYSNPKQWETGCLADVMTNKASNGFFAKRDEYIDDGNVAILGVVDIVNRTYSKIEGLPRVNVTANDIEKYTVKYGDMLFCRSSLVLDGIGKSSIVPKGVPDNILFECHVIRVPLDMKKCLPEFMQIQMTTPHCRNQIMAQSKTATMTTIGQDGILKTQIFIPSMEQQRRFVKFMHQADKSKVVSVYCLNCLQVVRKNGIMNLSRRGEMDRDDQF